MTTYNPKSMKAEEFISDAEIHETLAYAEANKNNLPLIEEILEKARPKKTETGHVCAGLTHREASVLLACDIPEVIEKIYKIAEEIKLAFYGNRIVIFAPLYLSNYCVNGCVYCPYHLKNTHIARKKLTQEEIAKRFIEVRHLIDFLDDGHHNQDVCNLVKISNDLLEQLNPANRQKAREWCEKKFQEQHGE